MKRVLKKLSIITCAAMIVGTSGMALAGNRDGADEMPLLPPMMARMAEKLDLTEAQKAQLEDLKVRQKALRSEFWQVFTEEQKNMLLEAMMRHRKGHGGEKHFRKGENHGERGKR